MYRLSEKKLIKQQYLLHMSSHMVNVGPLVNIIFWRAGKLNSQLLRFNDNFVK